jgi:hypothetical protein
MTNFTIQRKLLDFSHNILNTFKCKKWNLNFCKKHKKISGKELITKNVSKRGNHV